MTLFLKLFITLTITAFFYVGYYFLLPKLRKRKVALDSKKIILLSWLFSTLLISIIVIIKHYINNNSLIFKIFIQTLMFSIIPTFNFVIKPYFLSFFNKKKRDLSLEKNLYPIDNRIKVYNSEITNAFALGVAGFGKVIVIGDELKKSLDEVSLKGILFHEYAHHKFKHVNKIYSYTFIVSFVISVIIILTQHYFKSHVHMSIIVMLNGALYGLLIYYSLGLQKKMEYEADKYAASKIGNNKYVDTLKTLNKIKNGSLEKKSATHPTLDQRIVKIYENAQSF